MNYREVNMKSNCKKVLCWLVCFMTFCSFYVLAGETDSSYYTYPPKVGVTIKYRSTIKLMNKITYYTLKVVECNNDKDKINIKVKNSEGNNNFSKAFIDNEGDHKIFINDDGKEEIWLNIKYPIEIGQEWEDRSTFEINGESWTRDKKFVIDEIDSTVNTPAGIFKHCVYVRGVVVLTPPVWVNYNAVTTTSYYWYAPNIGLIKRINDITDTIMVQYNQNRTGAAPKKQ